MWVEKRGAASWRGGYRTAEGAKVQQTFPTEHEARRWAEAAEAAEFGVVDVAAPPVADMPLGVYARQWLNRRNGLQPKSMQKYRLQAERVAASPLAGITLAELTRSHVEQYFARLDDDPDMSVSQRNTRLLFLRLILKQATLDGALILTPARPDPTGGVRTTKASAYLDDLDADVPFDEDYPDDEPRGRWIPGDDIEALLTAAADPQWQFGNRKGPARMMFGDEQLPLAILLGCEAGLRWGEIGALGRNSVRTVDGVTEVHVRRSLAGKGGRIGPTKNGKARWVPVSSRLAEAIARQQRLARLAQRPLLVTRPDGSPMRYDWSADHLDHAAEQAGIAPLRGWHDLRHTYGSTLADHGVPVQRIADLMGHAADDVTRLYVHKAPLASLRSAVTAVFG